MNFKEIIIKENEYSITLNNVEPVLLEKLPPKKFNVDDIKITAFNKSEIFKGFADYSLDKTAKNRPLFNPLFTAVIDNKSKPFCAIIGLWKILFIDFQNKTFNIILELNRKESDDRGFYFHKVLTLHNAFILIYESGIVRISDKGNIEFHNFLRWDDLYCKTDDQYIYYSSEHRENEDWRLRIEDGKTIEDWS